MLWKGKVLSVCYYKALSHAYILWFFSLYFSSIYLKSKNRKHWEFWFAFFFFLLWHISWFLVGNWRGYFNLRLSLISLIYTFPWIILWLVIPLQVVWDLCMSSLFKKIYLLIFCDLFLNSVFIECWFCTRCFAEEKIIDK